MMNAIINITTISTSLKDECDVDVIGFFFSFTVFEYKLN